MTTQQIPAPVAAALAEIVERDLGHKDVTIISFVWSGIGRGVVLFRSVSAGHSLEIVGPDADRIHRLETGPTATELMLEARRALFG